MQSGSHSAVVTRDHQGYSHELHKPKYQARGTFLGDLKKHHSRFDFFKPPFPLYSSIFVPSTQLTTKLTTHHSSHTAHHTPP